jgi:DNA-binding response OmpR family regulator
VISLLTTLLEAAGHDVSTAADGMAALKKCRNEDHDLYIFDIQMPWLDGYALANTICKEFSDRKVILMSSTRDFEKDKLVVRACGAAAHIPKPLDPGLLMKIVNEVLSPPRKSPPPSP